MMQLNRKLAIHDMWQSASPEDPFSIKFHIVYPGLIMCALNMGSGEITLILRFSTS